MSKMVGVVAGAAAVGVLLGGCSEYRVERQGKDAGTALCDLKNADDQAEVDEAKQDVADALADAARIVGRPIPEDVDDIEENLADLATHVLDGNDALVEQDLSAIRRNVEAIADQLSGTRARFYDGLVEGLGECTD